MREIGVVEARRRFGTLLDWVEQGEEIVIRRRKPLARLIPHRSVMDRDAARAAAQDIRDMSRGMTLGGLTIRELIDEGRR